MINSSDLLHISALSGLPCHNLPSGRFPKGRFALIDAVKRLQIAIFHQSKRGSAQAIHILPADLPPETRLALIQREMGVLQEDAPSPELWERLAQATSKIQERTRQRFEAVLMVEQLTFEGHSIRQAIMTTALEAGVAEQTVSRAWDAIQDVPRADWLPTLIPAYKAGGRSSDRSEEATSYFLGLLKDASARYPLKAAWRRTEKLAVKKGWAWPGYDTVRRWYQKDLSAGQKALLRSGRKALDQSFPSQKRTVCKETALSIVNIDGRMADVFVRWEDGSVSRPVVIALQDIYSRKVLGYEIAKSENADATKALLLRVFDEFGLFDAILMDNGRAFASLKLTGGAETHRFRWARVETDIKGIYPKLGISIHFATPAHGQAKPVERGFRDMAESIDTAPELAKAYCGHRPDAKPEQFNGSAVSIADFCAVYERDIAEHNARSGRRTEMAGGKKSFDMVFAESVAKRILRPLAPAQRRFFYLEQAICTVNTKTGVLASKGFRYWSNETQKALQPWRGKKVRMLFDPKARNLPVYVETLEGQLLAEVPCLKQGEFINTAHAQDHNRAKSRYKKAEAKKLEARMAMSAAKRRDLEEAHGLSSPVPSAPMPAAMVVAPAFGAPALRPTAQSAKPNTADDRRNVRDELTEMMRVAGEATGDGWRKRAAMRR